MAIDDPEVETIMSRDTDTRFLLREKLAVQEWLESNKTFHIMRDHPCHDFYILGGMFGTKKIQQIPSWINIMNNVEQQGIYMYDQTFLKDYIYPHIKDDSMIHATFHKKENNCRNFPIKYFDNFRFVGEYVYADESRNIENSEQLKTIITKYRKINK